MIGFFGPVVSLIVTVGASNVAGETKKSFMASAVFVAYCVGNIVGPQMVRSETKAAHYPDLWIGLIAWYSPYSRDWIGLFTNPFGAQLLYHHFFCGLTLRVTT
jgi:hypothetical protein